MPERESAGNLTTSARFNVIAVLTTWVIDCAPARTRTGLLSCDTDAQPHRETHGRQRDFFPARRCRRCSTYCVGQGYRTIGPVVQDAVVQYLTSIPPTSFPLAGQTTRHLGAIGSAAWTHHVVLPGRLAHRLKPYLFHAREVL